MTGLVSRDRAVDAIEGVARLLEEFFEDKQRRAAEYGDRFGQLWASARRSSEGGKRFRPALVVSAYHSFGGDREGDVVALAAAFELLHTAFLLHDDVIDGDTVRRGQANVVGDFANRASERGVAGEAARAWGESAAILAGDLLIHSGQALVARLSVAEHIRLALLDVLDECMFVTAAGELADMAFSTAVEHPDVRQVLSMAQWKTAHYSFQAPLQAGAILAAAPRDSLVALGRYGTAIGIAFQLRDDILGAFGREEETGKSASSDLRAGKITPLMHYTLHGVHSVELRGLLETSPTPADVARIRQLLEESGARRWVEELISDYTRTAVDALADPSVPKDLRETLTLLAKKATERTS